MAVMPASSKLVWCVRTLTLLTAAFLAFTHAFNVDTRTAIVHKGLDDTEFGFAVALHRVRGTSWLLVGAPKAQTNQENVTTGGAVYKCSTDLPGACVQVPFDRTGSNYKLLRTGPEQTDNKTNQWFGATVQSSGEDGLVVACAPRYVHFSNNMLRREPVGSCWLSRDGLATFQEYSPCRESPWGFHRQGSCQAGLSAAITKDGKQLFVGAVGSWYWQGQVFSLNFSTNEQFSTRESPEHYDDSYLGYSAAVGEFTGDDSMDVAVGMPRGNNLTGKVVLFTSTLYNIKNITGDQLGAYFGYSLCVADINGDRLDDIIVGAPLFSNFTSKEGGYEEGRVYIVHQNSKHDFEIMNHLDGEYSGGRFGLALASLKDINRDNYQDIAVGTPYGGKDGKGVVYIFHGSSSGIMQKPSQIINAEDFDDTGIHTFGFSISGGMDMDKNEYPDLLIGAYESNRAVYLRSRPVINITSSLKLDPETIALDEKHCTMKNGTPVPCIVATLCLEYSGIGAKSELDLTYQTILDLEKKNSRAFFLSNETQRKYNVSLRMKKDSIYCNNTYIYIQNDLRDKLAPIVVHVGYELVDFEPYRFDLKPILNQDFPPNVTAKVNIEKNCGKDDICIPDLQLNAISNVDQFVIGSKKRLELDVTIHNAGEDAFEAMMYLSMPLDVNYININKSKLDFPVSCSGAQPELSGVNELICDIGNPLPSNKTLNFIVLLAPSRVVSSVSGLVFSIVANSTNAELDRTMFNNGKEIILPVRVEVDITLRGISHPQSITYNTSEVLPEDKVRESDIGREVIHVYEFRNEGPSTILEAEVHILWPTYTLSGNHLLYLMDQPAVKGKGRCNKVDDVNPLNVKKIESKFRTTPSPQLLDTEVLKVENVGPTLGDITDSSLVKRKREIFNNGEEENRFSHELSCGPTLCSHIICIVSNIAKAEQVIFTLKSRMWKATYDQLGVADVQTSSKMVTRVTSLPYGVDPNYLPFNTYTVTTKVNLEDIGLKPYDVPWWIIILAIAIGLLLLILMAFILWKLGFFKRKRPEEKEGEKLLHGDERNGYQMAKGDAVL